MVKVMEFLELPADWLPELPEVLEPSPKEMSKRVELRSRALRTWVPVTSALPIFIVLTRPPLVRAVIRISSCSIEEVLPKV